MLWFCFYSIHALGIRCQNVLPLLTYCGAKAGEIVLIHLSGVRSSNHFIKGSSITQIAFTSGTLSSQNPLICTFDLLWQANTRTYKITTRKC